MVDVTPPHPKCCERDSSEMIDEVMTGVEGDKYSLGFFGLRLLLFHFLGTPY